ncbi:MAG: LacI family DNA-binding transcriptional regulator [Gammaproteobacteria bacterium]|nr:LacI family DNA-binding transcriptional regulator [Gammaproteobacteria bacterium]
MSHRTRLAVTIRDVANHANVAMKTVSRVLNNEPNVREETRARVFESVNALGYKPNISARNLAGAHSYGIGIFYDILDCPYFNMMLIGALDRCREEGYQLVVETFDEDFDKSDASIIDRIRQLTIDGVILPEPICNKESLIEALFECHIPYVRVSPETDIHNAPYVCVDDHAAVYNLTSYLISLGHKNLGIIRGREQDKASSLRYEGFCAALRDHDLSYLPENEAFGSFTYSSGLVCAEKILSHKNRPTAVFASNDEMAAAVIATANRLGLNVPKDLSVAGFDNSALALNVLPNLTTVNQNARGLGNDAAALLFRLIKHHDLPDESEPLFSILDYKTIIRGSTSEPNLS